MNLYFPLTEHNELHIPVNQLSSNIFEAVKDKIDEKSELNTDSLGDHDENINNNLEVENIEDLEMMNFHEKYTSKLDTLKKTEAHKKINKIKIYFIVKSKIVKGEEITVAIPIRCFDDLGNAKPEKFHNRINTLFHIDVFRGRPNTQGSPALKPFILEDIVFAAHPFGLDEEFSLEDLILPKEYGYDGIKLESGIPESDLLSRLQTMKTRNKYTGKVRTIYYLSKDYDYNEAAVDNTIFSTTSNYVIDTKKTNNTFAQRLKEIEFKKEGFKIVSAKNLFKLVWGNRTPLVEKSIIPVFSNLEDAQNLLITVLEEVNKPFQARRKMEGPDNPQSDRSLDYLDDPFCYQNRYFYPESGIDKIKDFLRTYRFIKEHKRSSFKDDLYHENKYQTKGPFSIADGETADDDHMDEPLWIREQAHEFAPRHIWRETDCLLFEAEYFPGEREAYSFLESRDMSVIDEALLKKSQDVKIISMGLADFLEFWNNPTTKTGELLFIPSSKHLNKSELPVRSKKRIDPFYEYQQKFYGSTKKDTENYTYEIIVSPD
uniref:Uncharacterized protein Escp152 n=1 Tax=Ectocarpus siliculosus TaxID=2880 RepID=D1J7B0_ECTSI|nr:Chloroplast conserved hypothetical protein [Ectocarpus siliculosus]CAT18844.1 Chloroplast conserved hypothetical protein [Ectocarpus siliculosus]CAV31294.1 Chloroplast conserved hypothetical protein [Ectocarpus siliculosus]